MGAGVMIDTNTKISDFIRVVQSAIRAAWTGTKSTQSDSAFWYLDGHQNSAALRRDSDSTRVPLGDKYPIGYVYAQFPGELSPAGLNMGGSWEVTCATDSFFRADSSSGALTNRVYPESIDAKKITLSTVKHTHDIKLASHTHSVGIYARFVVDGEEFHEGNLFAIAPSIDMGHVHENGWWRYKARSTTGIGPDSIYKTQALLGDFPVCYAGYDDIVRKVYDSSPPETIESMMFPYPYCRQLWETDEPVFYTRLTHEFDLHGSGTYGKAAVAPGGFFDTPVAADILNLQWYILGWWNDRAFNFDYPITCTPYLYNSHTHNTKSTVSTPGQSQPSGDHTHTITGPDKESAPVHHYVKLWKKTS